MFRVAISVKRNFPLLIRRNIYNSQSPFHDDLTEVDVDDFNLSDFQHYQESSDLIAKREQLLNENKNVVLKEEMHKKINRKKVQIESVERLTDYVSLEEPLTIVSKISDPYINLAIEDYIYNQMPLPKSEKKNYNRLLFYTNSPCVVIGKNQNPWREVNLPLLNSLKIPLIRRRSGGGTVVHDFGNLNYSFMTTKSKFDRFSFANLIRNSVNRCDQVKYKLEVNSRGDITTETQSDGINYKISGSAYKLSKGKSYHHGTMLLNSRLDILGNLLSRSESLGDVDSMGSIHSVKSKVANLELSSEKFIKLVSSGFKEVYGLEDGIKENHTSDKNEIEDFDQNELFGLTDFVEENRQHKDCKLIYIDSYTELPKAVAETATQLQEWSWKFGATPKFTHTFVNKSFGFTIVFYVSKGAIIEKFDIKFGEHNERLISEKKIIEGFEFLTTAVKRGNLKYSGSDVAGYITNDIISDWIGLSIDGTV